MVKKKKNRIIDYFIEILGDQLYFLENLPNKYIKSLKEYTVGVEPVTSYKFYEDYDLDMDIYSETRYRNVSDNIRNIMDVFYNIPPIKYPFVVYRGVHIKNIGELNFTNYFISTSFNISVANKFSSSRYKCCILEIYIRPGSKIIPLFLLSSFPGENEILLDKRGIKVIGEIEPYKNKRVYRCVY